MNPYRTPHDPHATRQRRLRRLRRLAGHYRNKVFGAVMFCIGLTIVLSSAVANR